MSEREDIDREVEDMERSAEKVQDDIDETRKEWEAKQDDGSVPGAVKGESPLPDDVDPGTAGD